MAGVSCPAGSLVSGFDAAGGLICRVPGLEPSLIFQWSFEDAGDPAHDVTENGFNGDVHVGMVVPTTLGLGHGLELATAVSDAAAGSRYVSLPDADAVTPLSPTTIDLWIYPYAVPKDDGNNYMLVHKYQNNAPSNSDYLIELQDGQVIFGTQGARSLAINITEPNQWYHVTAIANGPNSHLFVNGAHVSGPLEWTANGDRPFVLGTCMYACAPNNRTFVGIIDEVRLFSGIRLP